MSILEQKWPIYPILGMLRIFLKNPKINFTPFLNAFHPAEFQKSLIHREEFKSREEFKNNDFGSKNIPLWA